MDSISTGKFIAKKRKERKLTQNELADLLQVTNKAISRWETGEGYPEISILPHLADRLGCTIDEILKGGNLSLEPSNDLKAISKFEMMSLLSIAMLIFGFLIGVMLIYLTKDKYWALLPFFTFGFIGLGFFIYFRYRYINDSAYQDSDKQRIKRYTWKVTLVVISLIYALLPMYLFVLTFNFFGNPIVVEDAYLRFSNYLWIAPLMVLIGDSITLLIIHMIKLVKINIDQGDLKVSSLYSFIAFVHLMIVFVLFYTRISHDTLIFTVPLALFYTFIPYFIVWIKNKENVALSLINFVFGSAIIFFSFIHIEQRKIYIPQGTGGAYNPLDLLLLYYIPFMLIILIVSIVGLIKELKKKEAYTLGLFAYKNLIYLSVFFLLFFIFAATQNWDLMRRLSIIIIPVWYLQDFYMRFGIKRVSNHMK